MKKYITLISIIGSIASIIALILFFYSGNDSLDILVKCDYFQNLTKNESLNLDSVNKSKFKANYIYDGEAVEELWRLDLNIQNISKSTLISLGNKKNTLNDSTYLQIEFNNEIIVLDGYENNILTNLPHVLQFKNNIIKIYFEQWRSSERLNYSFYVAPKTKNSSLDGIFQNKQVFKSINSRQIIDGDLIYEVKQDIKDKNVISQFIGSNLFSLFRKIGIGCLYLFVFAMIFMNVAIIYSYIKRLVWFKRNGEIYKDFINGKNEIEKHKFLKNPSILKEDDWENFQGQKYPKHLFDFPEDNLAFIIFMVLTYIVMAFSFVVLIFSISD